MATWGTSTLWEALGNCWPRPWATVSRASPLTEGQQFDCYPQSHEILRFTTCPIENLQELFSAMQVFFSFCEGNPPPKTERPLSFKV